MYITVYILHYSIQEYYSRMTGEVKVPTKIFGDYGETLVLAHEYLRTKEGSNRQHLINKIPTPLGVGYDIQSVEIEKRKRELLESFGVKLVLIPIIGKDYENQWNEEHRKVTNLQTQYT